MGSSLFCFLWARIVGREPESAPEADFLQDRPSLWRNGAPHGLGHAQQALPRAMCMQMMRAMSSRCCADRECGACQRCSTVGLLGRSPTER